jgi:hypothetical protein
LIFDREPLPTPAASGPEQLPRKTLAQLKREYKPTKEERKEQERSKVRFDRECRVIVLTSISLSSLNTLTELHQDVWKKITSPITQRKVRTRSKIIDPSHSLLLTVAVPALPRNNVGYRMLSSMGWSAGRGLGARGDGRQTPIAPPSQKGHSGLGAKRGRPS